MDYIGKIAKLLIENHRKNRAIERMEIKSILAIQMIELNKLLYQTQEYFNMMGLEIIGISPTQIVAIDEAKKLFVRRMPGEDSKRVKSSANAEEKKLFTILSAVQLENNHMHEETILEIQKCKIFNKVDLLGFMTGMKTAGFLTNNKENEVTFWSLGWRFYVEYCDCFDIFDYFGKA